MDTNKKIERMTVDGRRTEVHVFEQPIEGTTHRITEHFEEIVPFEKKKKVIERIMPVVVERVTEQYNDNQVNKVVERVANDDPSHRLTLVPQTHPVTAAEVEAIVRKVNSEVTVQMPHPMPHPPTPVPTPPVPAGINLNNPIVSYALIVLLAVEVGLMIWQLFIR